MDSDIRKVGLLVATLHKDDTSPLKQKNGEMLATVLCPRETEFGSYYTS
jgi:hypothetical protein